MLRSIMNHSTYTTDNIMKEMPNTTYLYRAICNRKNKTTNILIKLFNIKTSDNQVTEEEIKAIISRSSQQVGDGVALVGETGEALGVILAQVSDINGLVAEIARAAAEQAQSLAQVGEAVGQMDKVTQENAAMVEQSTAASHRLTAEAQMLLDMIGTFRTGAEGAAAALRRAA